MPEQFLDSFMGNGMGFSTPGAMASPMNGMMSQANMLRASENYVNSMVGAQ